MPRRRTQTYLPSGIQARFRVIEQRSDAQGRISDHGRPSRSREVARTTSLRIAADRSTYHYRTSSPWTGPA
jgi:hypothetical protein